MTREMARETERAAYNRLIKVTCEMVAAGKVDRHSAQFKTKCGAVSEAIEIWRAAECAAGKRLHAERFA